MFIVMMMIMMATATAAFSVHSAAVEIRGRGFMRQNTQAGYLAEATLMAALDWVDLFGPVTIREQVFQGNGVRFDGNYPEVQLAPGRQAYRLYPEHFEALLPPNVPNYLVNDATDGDAMFGPRRSLEPEPLADIYDTYEVSRVMPGMALDGSSELKFLRATITARGRAIVPGDVQDTWDVRERNEVSRDVRAYIMMGPYLSGN